jgi:HSP20 family protein
VHHASQTPLADVVPRELPVDLKEDRREYVVFLDLPGVDEDEILLEGFEASLRISAPRDFNHDHEDAEEFIRLERPYGHFETVLTFAKPVLWHHITARYRRGVLKVRVPKQLPEGNP